MPPLWKTVAVKEKRLKSLAREIARLERERDSIESFLSPLSGGAPTPRGRGRRRGKWRPGGPGRPPKEWAARMKGRRKKKRGKWRPGRPGRPPKAWVEAQKAKAAAAK